MKRSIVVSVLVVATLLLSSSTSSAISIKTAGKQYLRDVAPANAALKSFDSETNAWTNATPYAEGVQRAALVLTAIGKLRKNLLSQNWPPFVKGGVQYLREDISALEADLSSIGSNTSLGNGTFQYTFSVDSKTMDSDAFYVRKDLGLPSSGAL